MAKVGDVGNPLDSGEHLWIQIWPIWFGCHDGIGWPGFIVLGFNFPLLEPSFQSSQLVQQNSRFLDGDSGSYPEGGVGKL